MSDPRSYYRDLITRVDALFASASAHYREQMKCGLGCTDCCRVALSVTLVEAADIAQGLADAPEEVRGKLGENVRAGRVCAALAHDGRCLIYASRPLFCRSHGLPIRQTADPAGASASITACPKNFCGEPGQAVGDSDMVLDQATVSTVLGAIDAAFADEGGAARGTRIELSELLARPGDYFEV